MSCPSRHPSFPSLFPPLPLWSPVVPGLRALGQGPKPRGLGGEGPGAKVSVFMTAPLRRLIAVKGGPPNRPAIIAGQLLLPRRFALF